MSEQGPSLTERFLSWLAGLVPRGLAYKIAVRFWGYAWNYVTDQQADHFMEVLQAGFDHWKPEVEEGEG